ncbi:MAG: hypothetical protein LBS59_03200 [Puniceicoccales bacterium]|nr:hypothetical protein [Puniceicoccales bacterium]
MLLLDDLKAYAVRAVHLKRAATPNGAVRVLADNSLACNAQFRSSPGLAVKMEVAPASPTVPPPAA